MGNDEIDQVKYSRSRLSVTDGAGRRKGAEMRCLKGGERSPKIALFERHYAGWLSVPSA